MNSSSFIFMTLVVGLVYLFSNINATPTDRTPDYRFHIPTDRTPDFRFNAPTDNTPDLFNDKPTDDTPTLKQYNDLVSRKDKSMINYLANTAAGYITQRYPYEMSPMSRQLTPGTLDTEETLKQLLVKIFEWVAFVVVELLYL